MATSYPGALDSLTNPGAADPLSSPAHHTVHANANDAIEAIEAALGVDPSGATGVAVGRWTTYTPTISGTGWALGNGTTVGVYSQVGKTGSFYVEVTWGTTSTFGTGALTVSFPLNVSQAIVSGECADTSAGTLYPITGAGLLSLTTFNPRALYSVDPIRNVAVIDSRPFTWADGDVIRIFGTYRAA